MDINKHIKHLLREGLSRKLNEGLIKSYEPSFVFSTLQRVGFTNDDFYGDSSSIKVEVKIKHKELYPTLFKRMENLMGWYLSGLQADFYDEVENNVEEIKADLSYNLEQWEEQQIFEDDDTIATLIFEPHYGNLVDENEIPNVVYHVTDKVYIERIKEQGLKPHHKDKLTHHPDRIYLFLDKKNVNGLVTHMDFDVNEPVLLTLDISEYKNKVKFYKDPNLSAGGAYVLQNIPPNLIINIEQI